MGCRRAWHSDIYPARFRFAHKVLEEINFNFSVSSSPGPALLSGMNSVPDRVEGMEKSTEFLKVSLSTSSVILGNQKDHAEDHAKLTNRKPPVIR
jgi:hypothetical protein